MKKIYIYIICSILSSVLYAQEGFGTYLRDVIQKQEKGILVTAKLIEACGLFESLDILMDEEYEKRYQNGQIQSSYFSYTESNTFYAPQHRKYGYTLFAETDEFWESLLGKDYKTITVADVAGYIQQHCQFTKIYRNDQDFSNPENILYQFVTYHLLNRRLTPSTLVNHYNELGYNLNKKILSIPICEYYTTMGDRRLLRVFESKESNGIYLNRFPVLDNGRKGSYHELSCAPDKVGIPIDISKAIISEIPNATIYPIGSLLAFDQATARNMGSIRLRMDVASIFPEMATNDIRLSEITDEYHSNVYLPCDQYPYLDDLTVNNFESKFCYWTGRGRGWQNMQGDEFCCRGMQDITLRLPPVPARGTYELRMATQAGGTYRGIFQLYLGTDPDNLHPLGIPVDFRQGAYYINTSSGQILCNIGYEDDTTDDYFNQMRDNELYENGYMKGCNQYIAGSSGNTSTMRNSTICLRRILGRQIMDPDKTYYLRIKTVLDDMNKYLYLDYIELCPKEVYDNPNEPEDIW
jgi:hypothetical protein